MTPIRQFSLHMSNELSKAKTKTVTALSPEVKVPLPLVDKSELTDAQRFLMDPLHFGKDIEFTPEELIEANKSNPKLTCKFFSDIFRDEDIDNIDDKRIKDFTQLATLAKDKEKLGLADMKMIAEQDGIEENISSNDLVKIDNYLKDKGNSGLSELVMNGCNCHYRSYETNIVGDKIIDKYIIKGFRFIKEVKSLEDGEMLSNEEVAKYKSGFRAIENVDYVKKTGTKIYEYPDSKPTIICEYNTDDSGKPVERSISFVDKNGEKTKIEQVKIKDHPEIKDIYRDGDDYYYYNGHELDYEQMSKFEKVKLKNGNTMLYISINSSIASSNDDFEIIWGSKTLRENYLKAYIDKDGKLMPGSPYQKH